MKIHQFVYHRPDSVEEALALLAELGDDAKVLAGGQSLVPLMALRLSRPGHVVDIGRLDELGAVAEKDGTVRVGAMVRHSELEASTTVRRCAPLVSEAMPQIAHRAIRNRGTACGSLAHGDPAAELPAVAVALDATLVLRSAERQRLVPATEFFTGYLTTVAEPDELLVEWRLPVTSPQSGWSVQEVSRRHGDFALLGCTAIVTREGDDPVSSAALAFFGAANTPVRVPEAESLIVGQQPGEEVFVATAEAVKKALDPPGDLHASVAYRRHLGAVLTMQCLRQATARMGSAA